LEAEPVGAVRLGAFFFGVERLKEIQDRLILIQGYLFHRKERFPVV
jgi:hypothetical protein